MIRRPPRSTQSRSSAASDVYKRQVYSHIKYSDKPFMGSVTHPERAQDSVEMAKILFGSEFMDPTTGRPKTVLINLINANSPMTFDSTMLGAAKTYARANQAC